MDGKEPPLYTESEYQRAELLTAQAFDKEELFPTQREALRALFTGRDVVSVLPTGRGKTLPGWALAVLYCILLNGLFDQPISLLTSFLPVVIYISPLRRLMQEQVNEFNSHAQKMPGMLPAARCSTNQPGNVLSRIRNGLVSVLYMSPEAALGAFLYIFTSPQYAGRIVCVFYDEAHLVLEWGEYFRKDFQQLIRLRCLCGFIIPWLAASATMTPESRSLISEILGLRNPFLIQQPNNRPEIYLGAQAYDNHDWQWIFDSLTQELLEMVFGIVW